MIYASFHKKLSVFAILFALLATAGCRETPRFDTTAAEDQQDENYLVALYNTRAINSLGAKSDDSGGLEHTDFNRTRGRTSNKDYWRNKDFRLNMVGYRILIAAYPLCPDKLRSRSMMVGVAARSRQQPGVEWAITPFDQADNKTLRLDDEIFGMGNEDIPPGLDGALRARAILVDYANRMAPLTFRVRRDDKILHITQLPQRFCSYEFVLEKSDDFQAYADDSKVHVDTAAMSDLSTDDELAAVIGHETAHNVMRHIPKRKWLYAFNVIANAIALHSGPETGLSSHVTDDAFNRDFEDEADYVGVYLAAAAGYDPRGALSAMQVIARLDPEHIRDGGINGDDFELFWDHPATAERYTQLRKAVEQIRLKQASGLPVLPDFD